MTAAWKEPYPGWVEGMNGPTGLIIGAARGNVKSIIFGLILALKAARIAC